MNSEAESNAAAIKSLRDYFGEQVDGIPAESLVMVARAALRTSFNQLKLVRDQNKELVSQLEALKKRVDSYLTKEAEKTKIEAEVEDQRLEDIAYGQQLYQQKCDVLNKVMAALKATDVKTEDLPAYVNNVMRTRFNMGDDLIRIRVKLGNLSDGEPTIAGVTKLHDQIKAVTFDRETHLRPRDSPYLHEQVSPLIKGRV